MRRPIRWGVTPTATAWKRPGWPKAANGDLVSALGDIGPDEAAMVDKVAEHVAKGARGTGATVELLAIDADGNLPEAAWATLKAADGIVFGSPTYMGSVSWQFKKFADASSKPWYTMDWKGKIAAGFTNSATLNGDKGSTIAYLALLAAQHKMLWTGTGMHPSNAKSSTRDDLNNLGGYQGLLVTSPSDAGVDEMIPGDLKTAEAFGANVADVVKSVKG